MGNTTPIRSIPVVASLHSASVSPCCIMPITIQGFVENGSIETRTNIVADKVTFKYLCNTGVTQETREHDVILNPAKYYYIGWENNYQLFTTLAWNTARQKWTHNGQTFWAGALNGITVNKNHLTFQQIGTQLITTNTIVLTSTATNTSTTLSPEFVVDWIDTFIGPQPLNAPWPASSGSSGNDPRVDCILEYLSWAIGDECITPSRLIRDSPRQVQKALQIAAQQQSVSPPPARKTSSYQIDEHGRIKWTSTNNISRRRRFKRSNGLY